MPPLRWFILEVELGVVIAGGARGVTLAVGAREVTLVVADAAEIQPDKSMGLRRILLSYKENIGVGG